MFGLVNANWQELTQPQQERYRSVYCGICRNIGMHASFADRIVLSFDMTFLAMLLMSLYEPESETNGKMFCAIHPLRPRAWVDNLYTNYAADMNIALAYYKALDDYEDDGKQHAKLLARMLKPHYETAAKQWPRQCEAIAQCIRDLRRMETDKTQNPDLPASCFGKLMAELMVYQEDLWAETLRGLGFHLGRFIYLADAMLDYDKDMHSGSYNPFLAHGGEKDAALWEEYLVLAMGQCTAQYEKLPLVQDKTLLDNILYSGVWVQFRAKMKKEAPKNG